MAVSIRLAPIKQQPSAILTANAEEVPAALARGLAIKNDPERLGARVPKERKIRRLPLGVLDLLY